MLRNPVFCFLIIHCLYLTCGYHAIGQSSTRFEQLTLEDGLSSGSIRAICQDSTGFIWIGTTDGLNRYDGLSFKVYNHIPGDTSSLSNNFITRLLVDRQGNLWIGTLEGLNFFDRQSGKFKKINLQASAPHGPRKVEIFALAVDAENQVWISTNNTGGIFKVKTINNNGTTFISSFIPTPETNGIQPDRNYILSIYFDKQNNGWVGFENGLYSLKNYGHPKGWQLENPFRDFFSEHIPSMSVEAITEDPFDSKAIIAVTSFGKIYRFHPPTGNKPANLTALYEPPNESLVVLSILKDQSEHFWVATSEHGLIRFKYDNSIPKAQFLIQQQYKNNPLQTGSLINNQVFALYEDRSGLIWAGTDMGVSIYNPNKENLSATELINNPQLGNLSVTAIHYEKDWLITGTDGKGILIMNKTTKVNTLISRQSEMATELSSNSITTFLKDRDDNLWVGTINGLSFLSRAEFLKVFTTQKIASPPVLKFTNLLPAADDTTSLSGRMIFALLQDYSGWIWVGTAFGLNCLDPKTKKVIRKLKDDGSTALSISNNIIRCLFEDYDHNIWVGTEYGLNRINNKTRDVTVFFNQPGNSSSLSGNRISCIAQTIDSVLWIGTNGAGLNRYNTKTNVFKHYTVANGLANNVIYSIIDDRSGSLWISTNNGLSRFNLQTETFTNYDVNDGLKSNVFNQGAGFRNSDGEIFFGNINGINSFYPERIRKNFYVPPIVITDLRIFDKSVIDGAYPDKLFSLTALNKVELNSKENFFSFEFAALNYINPAKNQFRYKLEGLNDEWINNGNRRYVSFTNMSPGDYVFHVTGSNNDGVWNQEGLKIMLIIHPPWFKTWYARGAAFVLASLFLYLIIYLRIQTVRKEKEREFASRSAKIKQQFLANMSHEIRTPMNAIVGMTRLLLAKNPHHDQKKYLDAIKRSSDHLLVIINDILDYSKIEEGKMKMEFIPFNIRKLMEELYETFQLKAEEKKLVFQCSVNDNVPVAAIGDPVRINEVLINLVGNALKFTSEGSVTVDCMSLGNYVDTNGKVIPDVKSIRFSVSDTGIGIPESQIEKIFESFSQSAENTHRQFGGTGLGLTISRQLVELHGGTMAVISKPGQGSVFSFTLPLEVTDSSNIRVQEEKPVDSFPALSKLRILLVEDNELNQIVAIDTLQFHIPGISIDVAANGKVALEKINAHHYDVVLMDIQLPFQDGYEITRIIRNELPEPKNKIVIIAMTAGALKSEAERCLEAGMNDYIAKPFDPAVLINKLSYYSHPDNK